MRWTDDQTAAITGKTNLIVNAAAGSGKTAVLTERITRKLIPDENGNCIGIDELLVVTFARDAAREMQERIKKSLLERLKSEKNKKTVAVLKSQIKKLPFADITTIDAFCMKTVKNNFHLLGVDPKFTIMDAAEAEIFAFECMEEYFTELYEEKNEDFIMLTTIYNASYHDEDLKKVIYNIYTFTRALASPDKWLKRHVSDYSNFSKSYEAKHLLQTVHSEAEEAESDVTTLLNEYARQMGISDKEALKQAGKKDIVTVMENDIKILSFLKNAQWNDIPGSNKFEKLTKAGYGKANDEQTEIQKLYIDFRNDSIKNLQECLSNFTDTLENLDKMYKTKLYPHARALCKITCGFCDYYLDKKTSMGKFEFNDLEHMTLKLLKDFDGIRDAMKQKYKEILMDEYQDTNELQETIFSLISTGDNRFIVGDMKQSIYRFRQSDPLLFLAKDNQYKRNISKGNRIVLSENFRSRKNVLDSINYLFKRIMTKKVGEIKYNKDQALNYGNKIFDKESPDFSYVSELYVLEGAPSSAAEETMSDIEREADFTAKKIKEMIDEGFPVLQKDGTMRAACENDFAILLGSVQSSADIYINALSGNGLCANLEDSGFFEKTEIKLLLEFVKTVNNPLRDIPILSVMRSPVYRFGDDELAQIRLIRKGEFYLAVKKMSYEQTPLGEKCRNFLSDIERWRSMSLYMTADRLMWRILSDSSLYDMCSILYGGNSARANIRLLLQRAHALSEDGIATLFDFERYITRLCKSDSVPCAKQSNDGVTIMTIHKSKGLEFPIVFVGAMGKKFVNEVAAEKVYLHKNYGFGINLFEKDGSISITSSHKAFIAQMKKNEAMSEQLRKLYVALTRAKEKLIVVGTTPNSNSSGSFDFTENTVSEKYILSCKSFLEFIAPVIKKCKDKSIWLYKEIPYSESVIEDVEIKSCEKPIITDALRKTVFSLLDKYDLDSKISTVPSKVSVSSLKSKEQFSVKLRRLPEIISKNEEKGAAYGTHVHSIMEKISFEKGNDEQYILSECEGNKEIADKIISFFKSPVGKRALNAKVVREAPFEINIPAKFASPSAQEGETTLLQGIIDCYFEENGEIVLVDYKTDVCSDVSELTEKYKVQLEWYKYALEKILHKKVKETYIYSFHKNCEVRINF